MPSARELSGPSHDDADESQGRCQFSDQEARRYAFGGVSTRHDEGDAATLHREATLRGATAWRSSSSCGIPLLTLTSPPLTITVTGTASNCRLRKIAMFCWCALSPAPIASFDIVAATTGGRFGTSTIANEFYVTTFVQGRSGLGAALAVLIFALVLPIIVLNRRAQKRADEMVGA